MSADASSPSHFVAILIVLNGLFPGGNRGGFARRSVLQARADGGDLAPPGARLRPTRTDLATSRLITWWDHGLGPSGECAIERLEAAPGLRAAAMVRELAEPWPWPPWSSPSLPVAGRGSWCQSWPCPRGDQSPCGWRGRSKSSSRERPVLAVLGPPPASSCVRSACRAAPRILSTLSTTSRPSCRTENQGLSTASS